MTNPEPMVVADPLAAFQKDGMLKILAPAKTNLFLGVADRQENGLHKVTTVMHSLSLHDVIHMDYSPESTGGLQVKVACYWREGLDELAIADEENLAVQAIRLLANKLERDVDETISLRIEKHIPVQAGLGGGSSDAAAALCGVAKIWGIETHAPEVLEAAGELGSDISFFLYGGCVCLTGVGETYSHRLDPMKKALVLIKPSEGASTRQVYQAFDENPVAIPKDVAQAAVTAISADDVPLYNNLSDAAESILPELAEIRSWAQSQPQVDGVLLSGSGSTTVVICNSFDTACKISSAARAKGWWTRATTFSSLRAAIVPK